MLMREKIRQIIQAATGEEAVFDVTYPDPQFGDYATNAALVLGKHLKQKPQDLAKTLIEKMDKSLFESVEVAVPGFINFRLKISELTPHPSPLTPTFGGKILLEYFQPNIAKPMHMGLLRTAVIGDTIKRMLEFLGNKVESDTHMGDWGTQFGYLILAQKKFGKVNEKLYAQLNADETQKEPAKQEFVKLEQGDAENRKIWQSLVQISMKEFFKINELMDILPFDHHWPESFYEDKMPAVLEKLEKKDILKLGEGGAKIVDLEKQNLGVAVIVKSDSGTTYLLRDLATFLYRKELGFTKQLYVVDNRQSHAFRQLFAILKLLGEISEGEADHIDYGFISFKGTALSTRKGNMVLVDDVIQQAEEKVAQIIADKNPDLKNKEQVIKAVAKGALKYFDLSHNRHSDIEFDWEKVLDFEGDSGPYLQYAYARLASILRKAGSVIPDLPASLPLIEAGGIGDPEELDSRVRGNDKITETERQILFQSSILAEIVSDAAKDYLPNILANYLFNFATLLNKFYHESPVTQEKNEKVKNFRLALITRAKDTLGQGLELLGIKSLEEM